MPTDEQLREQFEPHMDVIAKAMAIAKHGLPGKEATDE